MVRRDPGFAIANSCRTCCSLRAKDGSPHAGEYQVKLEPVLLPRGHLQAMGMGLMASSTINDRTQC